MFDNKLFKISTLGLGRNIKDWKKLILVNPWFLWKYSESYFEGKLDETRFGHTGVWSVAKMQLGFISRGIPNEFNSCRNPVCFGESYFLTVI